MQKMIFPLTVSNSFFEALFHSNPTVQGKVQPPSDCPGGAYLDSSLDVYSQRKVQMYCDWIDDIEKILALTDGRGIGEEI